MTDRIVTKTHRLTGVVEELALAAAVEEVSELRRCSTILIMHQLNGRQMVRTVYHDYELKRDSVERAPRKDIG